MVKLQTQLLMIREQLETLPRLQLPEGYTARSQRLGDEEAWERIIMASFGGEHHFDKEIAADEPYMPERVWFVCDSDDVPVATASAWYRKQWNEDTGYLHMVGLLPEQAGKKLGYYVSLAVLHRMVHEGRTRAVLNTDDFRLPAIKTYLNLGFLPKLAGPDHYDRWKALSVTLGRPITAVDLDGAKVEIGL
jgi:mycothiol synthase